ncbi:hypothetical protein UA08_09133 [Talaromyces atroroseus]|uniref:Subtelomeric hrmA-associated cluster protein AFUB-079030/YDR124W-like helical bundle domain-containing protein n=1 Tax=Talaromyces atroroseus TaxID=1441469 RepID=A0A1Q5Q6X7_TALAT|nr:hypothetical protein UA08_09133 [Talaromyces atroroseus]OKL55597.1 hypothetical protein UA08_09133 [Talaromyces atroroseus]
MSNLPVPVFDLRARDAFAFAQGLRPNGQDSLPSPHTTDHPGRRSKRRRTGYRDKPLNVEVVEAYGDSDNKSPLQIADTKKVTKFYTMAFKQLQQLNCRLLAKTFIKLIEPRKQVGYPYKGGEGTKPDWWPHDVRHREPDHLRKPERVELLVHLVQNLLRKGVTVELLEEAVSDIRRHLIPEDNHKAKTAILDEIIHIKKIEKQYLRMEIDGTIQVYVTNYDKYEDESEPKVMTPPQSVSSSPRKENLEVQSPLEMDSVPQQVPPQETVPSFQMRANLNFTNPMQTTPPEFGHPPFAYAPTPALPLTSTHDHFIVTGPTSHLYAVSLAHPQASPPAGFTGTYPACQGSPVDHSHGAGSLMSPQVDYSSQPFTVPDLSDRRGHEKANIYSQPLQAYSLGPPHTIY